VPQDIVNGIKWELFDLTKDWTQNNDVAAANPEKLKELQDLFWVEAALYFLVRSLRTGSWRDVLLAGAAQGLAFLCKSYLATIVFGISKSLWLSVAALAVLGGADMLSVYVRQTLVQLVTPDAMRGRVAAVSSVFIGASNELGEFESGVVARFLGPVGAAIFGGVGALVVTALWAKLFPALRKADRLE